MSNSFFTLQVGNLPSNRLALTNKIYISNQNYNQIREFYTHHKVTPVNGQAYLVLLDNKHPYTVEGHNEVPDDSVALNGLQRRFAKLSLAAKITLFPMQPYPPVPYTSIEIHVDTLTKSKAAPNAPKPKPKEIDTDRLAQTVLLNL
jgi:hypothetical protein